MINGADPYGYATVPVNGYFNIDRARALTISSAQSWLSYEFSTTSGFSTDLYDQYNNHVASGASTYICGTTYMPDVPNIYNGDW